MSGLSINQNASQLNSLQMRPPMGKNGPGKPDVDDMVNNMAEELDLTAEQKEKLTTILKDNMSKMDAEMKNNSASGSFNPEAMKSKMDENRTNIDNQIKSILNETQATKFQTMTETRNAEQFKKTEDFQSVLSRLNDQLKKNEELKNSDKAVNMFI